MPTDVLHDTYTINRHQEVLAKARRADGEEEEGVESLQAEEVRGLSQTIQRKEQELKLLRLSRRKARHSSSRAAAASATSPLVSPEAARRSSDRISFLHGIRDVSTLDV